MENAKSYNKKPVMNVHEVDITVLCRGDNSWSAASVAISGGYILLETDLNV